AASPTQSRLRTGDEKLPRYDAMATDDDRSEIQQPQPTDRAHDLGVTRIPERLVFHRPDFSLVGPRHRGQTACRVKRLQLSDRSRKVHTLEFRQCIDLPRL